MSSPRRYRIAVRAYPAGYRRDRGPELLSTLAEGDDDRGRPSSREAAALAYRGLIMRAGVAASADGLLLAAAAVLIAAMTSGFTWAERVVDGRVAAYYGTDIPGMWWQVALAVVALVVLTVGRPGAWDNPRRRRAAVLLAAPLALAVFATPGKLFTAGVPDMATATEFLEWLPAVIYSNWQLTVPASIGSVLAVAIALRALDRLSPPARPSALAGALALLGAGTVAQAWHRPDLPPDYGRSAFADLGPATFLAALGLLLALAAIWRMRQRARLPA